jgi:hypothetical protein
MRTDKQRNRLMYYHYYSHVPSPTCQPLLPSQNDVCSRCVHNAAFLWPSLTLTAYSSLRTRHRQPLSLHQYRNISAASSGVESTIQP